MVAETYAALHDLRARTDVRVVVLTGAGDRFFCPGADLDHSKRTADAPPPMPDPRVLHIPVMLHEMPQVTLRRSNGSCAGAGFGWAAACDLRVCVEHACSRQRSWTSAWPVTWACRGRSPGCRCGQGARAAVPAGKFGAVEALRLGLVSEVFEAEAYEEGVS